MSFNNSSQSITSWSDERQEESVSGNNEQGGWTITVKERKVKVKSQKMVRASYTIFVLTSERHLTLARSLEEIYEFDQRLRSNHPALFQNLPPPLILSRPPFRLDSDILPTKIKTMSSTSTLMSSAQKKAKNSKRHMLNSISRTLSPAKSSSSRFRRSINPIPNPNLPPTPPHSPASSLPIPHDQSDDSPDDDFVQVSLSEIEKKLITQSEIGIQKDETQIGSYLSHLSRSKLTPLQDHHPNRDLSLVRDTKDWQAFFKIGKHDFDRQRPSNLIPSNSLVSSLRNSGPPKPARSQELVDNGPPPSRPSTSLHPASMKRIKSDQIVYSHPPSLPPPAPLSTPEEISLSPDPLSHSAPSQFRRDVELELGLSPADVDAIDQLTTELAPLPIPPPSSTPSSLPPSSSSYASSLTSNATATAAKLPSRSNTLSSLAPDPSSPPERVSTASPVARRPHQKVTVKDFEIIRVLGKGCAGKVLMVKYRKAGAGSAERVYAMKSIKKHHVLAHRELQHTLTEQSVLRRVADEPESNPFIVRLWFSFHDKDHLFLVMDFHPGGDLATQLARWGRLGRDRARFYAAEITEGVTSLHRAGVIYRDLKPENILIAFDGHIVLTDFGLSKQFGRTAEGSRAVSSRGTTTSGEEEEERTMTFCGTAEYLAPEVLLGEAYSYEVDWWSFGTMLYEMLTGLTPFWSEDHATMYRRVLHDELTFSDDSNRVMDHDTKTLLRGLLQRNPSVRMTGERIKKHPYFGMIDWDHVRHKRYIPPYVPAVNPDDATDTQNFDETFLAMEPTYVQDDEPEAVGGEEQKVKEEAGQEGPGEVADSGPGKLEPQGAVDENGRDVFDGYSYLAPRGDRESIIEEDEEEEGELSGETCSEDAHERHGKAEGRSKGSAAESQLAGEAEQAGPSSTGRLANEQLSNGTEACSEGTTVDEVSSGTAQTTGDEEEARDEEEGWDVVDTPEGGQWDMNGRRGKLASNTLFARGVVDKYKLRMRKFNDQGSLSVTSSSAQLQYWAHQSTGGTPYGSSKSSVGPVGWTDQQSGSSGRRPKAHVQLQRSDESETVGVQNCGGGSGKGSIATTSKSSRRRFGIRTKKSSSITHHEEVESQQVGKVVGTDGVLVESSKNSGSRGRKNQLVIGSKKIGATFMKSRSLSHQISSQIGRANGIAGSSSVVGENSGGGGGGGESVGGKKKK